MQTLLLHEYVVYLGKMCSSGMYYKALRSAGVINRPQRFLKEKGNELCEATEVHD